MSQAIRSAPDGGYHFGRKRDYRRKVWATFRDNLHSAGIAIPDAHALLMPSLEGSEIETALNAGFREQNLHVVDRNPAIVATLKKRYPRIVTYGVDIVQAFRRLASDGIKIRCANLDFCHQVSGVLVTELSQIALLGTQPLRMWREKNRNRYVIDSERYGTGVFEPAALVAVTMLRGRESNPTIAKFDRAELPSLQVHEAYSNLDGYDRQRILIPWMILSLETQELRATIHIAHGWLPWAYLIRAETYISSNGQSMIWGVFIVASSDGKVSPRRSIGL